MIAKRCLIVSGLCGLAWLLCQETFAQDRDAAPHSTRIVHDGGQVPNQVRILQTSGIQDSRPESLPPVKSALNPQPQSVPVLSHGKAIVPEDITPGVTLDELVRLAMTNNPSLRAAAQEASAARGRAHQAGLYPNPVFATSSPQLAGDQSQYNAFWSQDVITSGKLKLDSQAEWRSVRETDLRWRQTHFEVLTTVRRRFYTALAAQTRVDILANLADISRKSKTVGDRLLRGGEGTRTDALLLDIEYDRATIAQRSAQATLDANLRQLAAGVGMADLIIPRVSGDLDTKLPEYEMLAVQAGVISLNTQAEIAAVEISRSEILLRRAEAQVCPNINFMGGWQYQLPGAGAPLNQGIYQVTFAVPLWNRNQGAIRAAQATVGESRAQLGEVRNQLANDTAEAVGRYMSARTLVEAYENQILPKARETQRLTQQLYSDGQIDFLRLLETQRTLFQANLEYINAQEVRWNAAADVAGLLQTERFP